MVPDYYISYNYKKSFKSVYKPTNLRFYNFNQDDFIKKNFNLMSNQRVENGSMQSLNHALYHSIPEIHIPSFYQKRIETQLTKLPILIDNPTNFNLQSSIDPIFCHAKGSSQTLVAYNLNDKVNNLPFYQKRDKDTYSRVHKNFEHFASNEE